MPTNYSALNSDLSQFRVVPPDQHLRPEDMKLPDGTSMIGQDGLLIPPARAFNMVLNVGQRMFSYRFDEAMRDNFVNARAMRRDAFIEGLLEERYMPTINRRWQLEVDDEHNPDQRNVREALTKIVESIHDFDAYKRSLLEGIWYGRAGCQWGYSRDRDHNGLWGISRWDPIHGDSIQFTFDGVPAILMDSMTAAWYSNHGAKWGPDGDLRYTDRGGPALVLQHPFWRDRYAIHVHIKRKADYFEGELAGSVQGFGLRGQVYWQYIVRTEALAWMTAYMQAVGQMDLLVFNYPSGNNAAKLQQEANAQKVIGKAAIVCPRNPNGNWAAVEQISMNEAGLRAMHQLVADYYDRHIERLVVGQSMSSGADHGTGLGGTGRAEFTKACVPVEGSEILTREGFKSPEDVKIGEDILAYDPETDQCRWTPLLKKSFYEDALVEKIYNKQGHFEAYCTPDHSWAVERPYFASDCKREVSEEETVTGPRGAKRLSKVERYLQKAFDLKPRENIILASREVETTESILTPTEASILGWAITDGTIDVEETTTKGIRYAICIQQSKEENFETIRKLILDFTGKVAEGSFHTPERTFPMDGRVSQTNRQHWWYIPRELSTKLLNKCGFRTKADLRHIVTRLSSESRKAMLKAMMLGDGCEQTRTFTNTDLDVIEALDILCALEGIATSKLKLRDYDPRYKQCYDKTLKNRKVASVYYLIKEEVGRTRVWCPTTKYGTWVMRQNGRVMITGNTKDEILVHDTNRLDETLTRDLIAPLKRYNFPWARFPVRFKSTLPDLDKAAKVASGATLIQAGVAIKVDEWREAAGFTRPEEGDEVIGGPPPMPPGMAPGMAGPPGGMSPPGMAAGGPGGMPMGAGAGGQLPGGSPLGPGGMAPPVAASAAIPGTGVSGQRTHGYPLPGTPALGPSRNAGEGAPAAGPAMGYPGGGNTYLPKFGNKYGFNKPLVKDKYGFTKYDAPNSVSYRAGKFDYSSTQIDLTGEAAIRVLALAGLVREEDLANHGRETDAHVTVRFGLHTDKPADVADLLGGTGAVKLKLGKVSYFSGEEYDVLKVDVESQDLRRLNKKLAELPHTDTHPTYRPHATIAYVKKGKGKEYAKIFAPIDLEVEYNQVTFSNKEGQKTYIDLTEPTSYARHLNRAPKGGIAIRNRLYRGGRFAPAPEEESKLPDDGSKWRPMPPETMTPFAKKLQNHVHSRFGVAKK